MRNDDAKSKYGEWKSKEILWMAEDKTQKECAGIDPTISRTQNEDANQQATMPEDCGSPS